MAIALRHSRLIPSAMSFVAYLAALVEGALALLDGETEGFAIDATTYDSITAASYLGGPVGGTVAVIDTGTPANDLSNVALDSSNLTQSGTSPKMVNFSSSPYVRWTPHNLILQSQDIATTWTNNNSTETANADTAPDGTATADQLTQQTATTNCYITQSFTAVSGFTYCFSAYLKANGTATDWARLYLTDGTDIAGLYFDLTNGVVGGETETNWVLVNAGMEDAGGGWYRCYASTVVDNTAVSVRVELAEANNDSDVQSGDDIFVWGLQVNRGDIPTPYLATTTTASIGIPLGYDNAASQYGILCEPVATNVMFPSEDFGTSWAVPGSGTLSSNAATSPDGATTADELVTEAETGYHYLSRESLSIATGNVTASVYAKANGWNWLEIYVNNFGGAHARSMSFDLSNIATGTSRSAGSNITLVGASIEDIGDGWRRCIITVNAASAIETMLIIINDEDDLANQPTGDGTSGVYVWGAQVETGTVATSYIPTVGATATRAADDIISLASSFPLGTAHTAYVSAKAREVAIQHDVLALDANNSNEDESVFLYTDTSANILMRIEDGGSAQLAPLDSGVNATANTTFHITGAWATNDVDVSANGTAPTSDGTATMPTLTHLRLGNNPTPGNHLNGFIYKMVYVPRQVETEDGDVENWRYVA